MGRRRVSASLVVAMALHGAIAALVAWRMDAKPRLLPSPEPAPATGPSAGLDAVGVRGESVPVILMPASMLPALSALPLPAVEGPADAALFGAAHPLPNAEVDLPGHDAAALGGGAQGGSETWTGRRDREDLRAQSWNEPDRYRQPRRKTARRRTSNESLAREIVRAYDDRMQLERELARDGDTVARARDDDGREAPARVEGAIDPTERAAHVDVGVPATEAEVDGPVADDTDAVAASNERNPGAFELTRPRAGGGPDGSGVAGPVAAAGVSARGTGANDSTAALRAAVRQAPVVSAPTYARRQNPYFRKMYARMDRLIQFPRELALNMDQGEVVVRFTLHADGRVGDISVEKSSGFQKFDDEVTRAVSRGGPFGRVPDEIIGRRTQMTVRAPYLFRNPLIR